MAVVISPEPILEAGVREFLQRHQAEAEFATVCALVRACFPEMRSLEVRLQEDPDEENRVRVVLYVGLPESHPQELLLRQLRRYSERFVQEVPLSQCPLFVVLTDFEPD